MVRGTRSKAPLTGGRVGVVQVMGMAALACVVLVVSPRVALAQAHHASNGRTAAADPAPQPVITLERSACHGQCAEYKLAFYEDGQVVYDGVANVSKAGRWFARLPRETVEDLVAGFRRIGYDSLSAKYPPGLAESPIATTSLREGTKIKMVTHEEGSPFPPAALSVLEDRIDAAVQSVDWVK
jgi:Domain of unknown function (DUF6438)